MSGTIELPWPPRELTPNFRKSHHWRRYQKPAADYRLLCFHLTRNHLRREGLAIDPSGLIMTAVTFCPPDHRKRDDDGMIGSFKEGRDGVADALGVDDHKFRPAYIFAEPVKGGKIVVTVTTA